MIVQWAPVLRVSNISVPFLVNSRYPWLKPFTHVAMFGAEIIFGGLGVLGVSALWNIARGLGSFEARINTILLQQQEMIRDHETRIRTLED